MKHTKFTVWFSNTTYPAQSVTIHAFNVEQATILAKAERIKAGLDYTVVNIEY